MAEAAGAQAAVVGAAGAQTAGGGRAHVRWRALALAALAALLVAAGCSSAATRRAPSSTPASSAASTTTATGPSVPAAGASDADGVSPAALARAVAHGGTIETRAIPGGSTRFAARPAMIWLPPLAQVDRHARFPVLVLLHGTGGGPADWFTLGHAATLADRFAAAHGGRAPILVMPDINGTPANDTECMRTPQGADVDTYLSFVVPHWIAANLPVVAQHDRWGIAGLSEGGTCALVIALRGYPNWGFVGDFSGLGRYTVGDTDNPTATIAALFGGSSTAFTAHDPAVLLRTHRYPRLSLWFESGSGDRDLVAVQNHLAAQARPVVGAVRTATSPGTHQWKVWSASLASALPAYWAWVT